MNELYHYGTPKHSGRYPWGSGENPYHHGKSGPKFGVRRYQNKDGSLTEAGQKRYNREIMRNNQKKKKDRADEDALKDPQKWAREDLERTKQIVDSSSDIVKEARRIEKDSRPKPKKERMDLSKMTDQEMRQKINRELLEQQYNNLFGEIKQPEVSKGRKYVSMGLDIAGTALPLAASALSIALAVKRLKD